MGRELTPNRFASFTSVSCGTVVLCGISTCFQVLSPCLGQIAHALLTRPPLEHSLPFRRTSNYVPARLACVKHAASVRPEPGSNSDVQSFSSFAVPNLGLAKALNLLQQIRRLLSQKSDCSLSLDLLRCIVFKDRFAFVLSLNAGFIITKHPPFVKPFFQISDIFCIPQHVVLHSN